MTHESPQWSTEPQVSDALFAALEDLCAAASDGSTLYYYRGGSWWTISVAPITVPSSIDVSLKLHLDEEELAKKVVAHLRDGLRRATGAGTEPPKAT